MPSQSHHSANGRTDRSSAKNENFHRAIIAFDKMRKMNRFLAPLIIFASLTACGTVPYTNRPQFNIVSESEESQMGLQAYQETVSKAKISTDLQANAMVERVGRRIAAAADKPDYDWQFKLIDDPKTVNAF